MPTSKSDGAAEKALREITVKLVEQLDLFNTTNHLHSMGGLTPLEMQKLQNTAVTELERKQYLVTIVIPSKGHYEGMRLLSQVLKQSEQDELLSILENVYENTVEAEECQVKDETASYPTQETCSDCCSDNTSGTHGNLDSHKDLESDAGRSGDHDAPTQPSSNDDGVLLNSPVELQSQPESNNVASLFSAVTTEQQFESEANNVASVGSSLAMEQQLQPGSNNAASLSSAVTLDQQLQQGSNNAPSGSPPVQQQSQSKSPYFKFTLPYDGIVTCTVSVKPSSPQSPGSHEDKSSEQGVPNTTSENSNNDGDDHNGAASGVSISWYLFVLTFIYFNCRLLI